MEKNKGLGGNNAELPNPTFKEKRDYAIEYRACDMMAYLIEQEYDFNTAYLKVVKSETYKKLLDYSTGLYLTRCNEIKDIFALELSGNLEDWSKHNKIELGSRDIDYSDSPLEENTSSCWYCYYFLKVFAEVYKLTQDKINELVQTYRLCDDILYRRELYDTADASDTVVYLKEYLEYKGGSID